MLNRSNTFLKDSRGCLLLAAKKDIARSVADTAVDIVVGIAVHIAAGKFVVLEWERLEGRAAGQGIAREAEGIRHGNLPESPVVGRETRRVEEIVHFARGTLLVREIEKV